MTRPLSRDNPLILYGAGGVTGQLILQAALARNLPVLLAGRSLGSLSPLAETYGLEAQAAPLDATDPAALIGLLARGSVVLNAAGPFDATVMPVAQAAIAAGAAYVDVNGEVDSLVALSGLDGSAKAAGVPLVGAAGFGVAAGESLALHTARRLARPAGLRLGLDTRVGQRSRGADQSRVAALRRGGYEISGGAMRRTGFADRPWTVTLDGEAFLFVGAPLAEAWAAAHSTGVANVRAGIRARPAMIPVFRLAALAAGFEPIGRLMARRAASSPVSASETKEIGRPSTLIAEAWTAEGDKVISALTIATEGYAAAAEIAVAAAVATAGSRLSGFYTPAQAFGPDFILKIAGVERRDLG